MIQLRDVSFCYDRQQENGLKSINLNLSQGECIVLCGRSGCGKTTVTRLINGLIPRFYPGKMQGQVLIKGKNIKEIPMYKLAEITGSVFQNPRTQFFNVDTDSEIAFGVENEALPHKQLQVRVQKTIKELNLCNLSGRSIFALSGGEKQQIAFASVYAMEPDLYILDEPSSNLDAAAIQKLKEHLNVIRRQGKTIVIAEHRLYWLLELADRFVYLDKGEIKGIYTPSQLKKLSQQGRNLLGLRSADLSSIRPVLQNHLAAEPILELKEFSLFHNKQKILEGVNLSAAPGDIIAVVGPNGAGKTTLSRALCGLHKGTTGTFYWKGKPQNEKGRLRLSYMIMQDVNYQLFAESVEAECSFGMKEPQPKMVIEVMKELDLYSQRKRHPNTLSGGQKQRVAAAVSMVCGKELFVFDEPTSGLDFDSMIRLADMIQRLSSMGKIIFVVTHDYEFVCQTCTRIIGLEGGMLKDDFPICRETEEQLKLLFSVENKVSSM